MIKEVGKQYKKCFGYIRKSRNFIYSIISMFLVFTLVGFFVPPTPELNQVILDFIQELLEKTQGMNAFELIRFIFLNNLQSSFFGMVFGVVLGIFSVATTIVNGYILGFVASKAVIDGGLLTLWKIFPHGIFELPALFISLGLGLKLGTFVFQKKKIKSLKEYFKESMRVFFLIIVPLLIIAAIIEGILIAL